MTSTQQGRTFQLGPGGPDVGQMGIGTWAWGDRLVWGYGSGYTNSDLRTAFEISVNRGIRFFDTAELYGFGQSEQLLGEFIRAAGVGGEIAVATKFLPYPWRFGRGSVVGALRKSLDRLGMEQVDLYQIHHPSPLTRISEMMEGLADCVEAGLAKTVGVSNYSVEQMRQAHDALAARSVPLASNQVEYSLIQRQAETDGMLDLCHELDVTLIAYSPLGMGLLTGKYTPQSPPSGMRGRKYDRQFLASLQPLTALMRDIGQAHGDRTAAQVALNWVIAKGALPIPGAKNARQADDNLGALGWSLTREEVAALDGAADRLTNR